LNSQFQSSELTRSKLSQTKTTSGIKWLRRIHAWLGLWGAGLGLLFGLSGFLLNHHRDILKIPVPEMERSEVVLDLPVPPPADAKALAAWLEAQLDTHQKPSKITTEKAKEITWNKKLINQPAQWRVDFHNPQRSISAEYWVGNGLVSVKRQEANIFSFITRLHKGVGMGVGWILLTDTLAISLVYFSLSSLFMWTRLHGSRWLMAVLGLSSVMLASIVVLSAV
jgi:uncharacterized protein